MAIYTYVMEQSMTVRFTVRSDEEITEDQMANITDEPLKVWFDVLDVHPLSDRHIYMRGSLRRKED